jgi:hypothetical protein
MGFKRDPEGAPFKLNRMERMMSAKDENLDPIRIKESKVVNGITYYQVIDGRHRFARAIAMNQPIIKAYVV